MPEVQDMTERILYRLSLDPKARALAERLLGRFRCLVGNLPASADHHHSEPGGLYAHSVEVALGTLETFEGNIMMEHKPDGSVDSFQSSRNRPRWQYATFIAALCHDLGKLFDLELTAEERRWCPLKQTYADFVRVDQKPLTVTWRPERQRGAHPAQLGGVIFFLDDLHNFAYPRNRDIALALRDQFQEFAIHGVNYSLCFSARSDYFSNIGSFAEPAVRFYDKVYLSSFTPEETREYTAAVFGDSAAGSSAF